MTDAATAAPPSSDESIEHRESALSRLLGGIEIFGLALLVSSVVILVLGHDPLRTFAAIAHGAYGDAEAIHATLREVVPLVFAGLAVALPLRLGLFNIGAEGQLVLAGLAAGLIAATVPAGLAIPLAIAGAVVVGGLWGGIAGALRAYLGVHEVLSTILLNLIAFPLAYWIVDTDWARAEGQIVQTEAANASLPHIYPALAAGIVLAVGFDIWTRRTRGGLVARAVGSSPRAAEVAGLPVKRALLLCMLAAGAFAGLTGAQQVLDEHGRYVHGFSPEYGFTAIAVALLGRNTGVGVVIAALLLASLQTGAFAMDALQVAPREVANLVKGVVILVAAALTANRLRGSK